MSQSERALTRPGPGAIDFTQGPWVMVMVPATGHLVTRKGAENM